MAERTHLELDRVDWEKIYVRTTDRLRRRRRDKILVASAVTAALVPMCIVIEGRHPLAVAVCSIVAAALAAVAFELRARRALARAAVHRKNPGELLFLYRRELEDRLRTTRRMAWLYPAWLLLVFGLLRTHLLTPASWLAFAGMACVIAAAIAFHLVLRAPELRRELDALRSETTRE